MRLGKPLMIARQPLLDDGGFDAVSNCTLDARVVKEHQTMAG